MPQRRLRSRNTRKVHRKVPGNATHLHHKKRKPRNARCGNCGAELKGMPREFPMRMRSMPKTKKRPQRPFGGVLCTKCMRMKIVDKYIQ